ncbi:Transmembrane protein, partial [Pseudolycoriella hygida]
SSSLSVPPCKYIIMKLTWGWAFDGVNASIPRNTGPECAEYLSIKRHWIEGRQLLLIAMTFTLGMELGFKLSQRSVIYILNPCHITSIIQIYLLSARPCKSTTALFRIHLNYLNGPLLAFLLPEIESRTIPFEACTYYVQHGLMFIIPVYLMRQGGAYNMEELCDMNWNVIGYSLLLIYHFSILVIFAVPTQINLNHVLCPALSDPFQTTSYRLCAVVHEALLCTLLCKIYCILFRPSNLNFTVNIINKNDSKHLSNDNIGCDDSHDNQNQNHVEKMNEKIE